MPDKLKTATSQRHKPRAVTALRPDRGGLTFDAEGTEGGKYHSRVLHVPGPSSGLTIGRGYDMGSKSAGEITTDLVAAGVELAMAKKLSGAATLRGENAKKFIKDNSLESFEIGEWHKRSCSKPHSPPRSASRGGSASVPASRAPASGTSCIPPYESSSSI